MFGLFGGGAKKPQKPVVPYVPPGMPHEVALPTPSDGSGREDSIGRAMMANPSFSAGPETGRETSIGQAMMARVQPPPGVAPLSPMMPPRRPADLPAPGAANAGPAPPATGTPAGPGHEYFQTQDDTGRSMWSTRPSGHAGSMPGMNDAAPQFQNAGTGMSFDQVQNALGGSGSGFKNFFGALAGGPPGAAGGVQAPPGYQGPMPNGQTMDQVYQPQAQSNPGFQNPLVADPNASAASNMLTFFRGLGGF